MAAPAPKKEEFHMEMSVVEKHFKDEADRNSRAAREANYEIGSLRAGKNYAEKECKHFKSAV